MRRRLILAAAATAVVAAGGLAALLLRDGDDGAPVVPTQARTTQPATTTAATTAAATAEQPPATTTAETTTPPPSVTPPPAAARTPPPAVDEEPLRVGVVEDTVKVTEERAVADRMAMLSGVGFRALRMTTLWRPGLTRPAAIEGRVLANAVRAARLQGMSVYLSVFAARPRDAPTSDARRHEFAAFTAALVRGLPGVRNLIVGNEPNLNNFWLPQFDADGASASPRDYNALLAATYDAVKGVSPEVRVLGGALAPRGGDNPNAPRQTHSPTQFLREWGRAYRASGRQAPVMDALAFHPYLEYSRLSPEFEHPRTTTIALADYGKLVAALGEAFDGTAQAGSSLPIAYTEFGVQTRVPEHLRARYENHDDPAASDAVDGTTQAAYYRRAIELASCQRTVETLLLFLAFDEPDVARWQSGVFYVDGSWKPSRTVVRRAAGHIHAGRLTCEG